VKVSVTSDYNSIDIYLMSAPWVAIANEENRIQVNHYYFMEDERLTKEAKVIFQLIDEIIAKYHWDESDPMTDYFNCAFYYSYAVGKWDRPFVTIN
jgi:hypothetical protein